MNVINVPVSRISIGDRFRKDLGDIPAFSRTIGEKGMIQPIVIDKDHNLICGHRRLEAYKLLGKEEIPAIVLESSLPQRLEVAENVDRKDYTLAEKVGIFEFLKEEFGIAHGGSRKAAEGERSFSAIDAAQQSGFSSLQLANDAVQIVQKGDPSLIKAVDDGMITISAGKELSKLPHDEQRKALESGKAARHAAVLRNGRKSSPGGALSATSFFKRAEKVPGSLTKKTSSIKEVEKFVSSVRKKYAKKALMWIVVPAPEAPANAGQKRMAKRRVGKPAAK